MAGPIANNKGTHKRKATQQDGPATKKAVAESMKDKKPKDTKRGYSAAKDDAVDVASGLDTAFAHMGPELVADRLAAATRRFEPDLSLVELEERRAAGTAIRDTTGFGPARTLDEMPGFVQKFAAPRRKADDLGAAPAGGAKGAPHTLVVTGAGLRAADVTRALRQFQSRDAVVAKLFAKHIKLDEAREYVRRMRISIGVGTPKRISDLLDSGDLSADALERIIIDASHIDQKKRGILDMKELQPPLMDLLNRPEFRERYDAGSDGMELLFY